MQGCSKPCESSTVALTAVDKMLFASSSVDLPVAPNFSMKSLFGRFALEKMLWMESTMPKNESCADCR